MVVVFLVGIGKLILVWSLFSSFLLYITILTPIMTPITANVHDYDLHVIANPDDFVAVSAKYQHPAISFLVVSEQNASLFVERLAASRTRFPHLASCPTLSW